MNPYSIAITLIAKGSMNNLHRREIVDAFNERGVEVKFLVREDYWDLIKKFPDCHYLPCRFLKVSKTVQFWRDFFCYLRSLYPAGDVGFKTRFKLENSARGKFRQRLFHRFLHILAHYKMVMKLSIAIEKKFLYKQTIADPENNSVDQLLLLGIGIRGAEHETALTWWAKQREISVVHLIGNYDHLSSKGYRGVPVDNLVVWGPIMRQDAVNLHGIPEEKIQMIGSLRYNAIHSKNYGDRKTFLNSRGLDPAKKTILFAGSMAEFHYFDMLQVFQKIKEQNGSYQLILRMYPDKGFMSSPYIRPLIHYAASLPDVYVSIGDPHFKSGEKNSEIPQFEEEELWPALKYSDVVVNLFSTIALEACLFDKPFIYIIYYPQNSYAWSRPPGYFDYGLLLHNRRMLGYRAMQIASNPEELMGRIQEAINHPDQFRESRKLVIRQELGMLDGKASHRLADACVEAFADFKRKNKMGGSKEQSIN
jgi:hypothetical protein